MTSWSFGLRFLDAGHVGKRDLFRLIRDQTGPAFTERHGLSAAALHLPHKKIQTPIRSSMGSHETKTVMYQGESSKGLAEILTLFPLAEGSHRRLWEHRS